MNGFITDYRAFILVIAHMLAKKQKTKKIEKTNNKIHEIKTEPNKKSTRKITQTKICSLQNIMLCVCTHLNVAVHACYSVYMWVLVWVYSQRMGDIENSSDVSLKKKRAKHRTQRERKKDMTSNEIRKNEENEKKSIEKTTGLEKSRNFFQAYPVLELQWWRCRYTRIYICVLVCLW